MAVPLRPVATRRGPAPVTSAYREYRAGPGVAPAVACTWLGAAGWPRRMRLLPDGCLDLVWDGHHARLIRPADRQVRRRVGDAALVAGIRIRPGWGAAVAGIPLRHLPDAADLADVWGAAAARQLTAALAATSQAAAGRAEASQAAAGPAAHRAVLTAAVATWLSRSAGPDPRVLAAVAVLARPGATAGAAARHAGLSGRQLRRLFDEHVGLPPQTLRTILRFQLLRGWLTAGGPGAGSLARAAADCGYFDQAHLSRDCARLAGLTPATLRAALSGLPCPGRSPGPS